MKKLYEITQDFNLLQEMLEQDAISQEAFNDTVESIEVEFDEKVGNLLTMRAEAISRIESVTTEIKRYQALLNAAKSNKEFIETYLREQMIAMKKSKVEDPKTLRRVSLAANSPVVLIKPDTYDVKDVAEKYRKPVEDKVDWTAIKNDLISGDADEATMELASLGEGKRKLTIK